MAILRVADTLRKYIEISLENLDVDIGAKRVKGLEVQLASHPESRNVPSTFILWKQLGY